MEYRDLLDALAAARPDTEVRVRTRSGEYRVTAAAVEYELGEHLRAEEIEVDIPERERARLLPTEVEVLTAPRRQFRDQVAACDGHCTEHRPMASDKRTVWLTVEKA